MCIVSAIIYFFLVCGETYTNAHYNVFFIDFTIYISCFIKQLVLLKFNWKPSKTSDMLCHWVWLLVRVSDKRWQITLNCKLVCVNACMCVYDDNAEWHIWNEIVVAMAQSQEETDCAVNDLHVHHVLPHSSPVSIWYSQYRILANLIFLPVNKVNGLFLTKQ